MISRMTPPGTVIICIDDEPHLNYVNYHEGNNDGEPWELVKGERYILLDLVPCDRAKAGFWVGLRDCEFIYAPNRFEIAALPSVLTEILTKAPIKKSNFIPEIVE